MKWLPASVSFCWPTFFSPSLSLFLSRVSGSHSKRMRCRPHERSPPGFVDFDALSFSKSSPCFYYIFVSIQYVPSWPRLISTLDVIGFRVLYALLLVHTRARAMPYCIQFGVWCARRYLKSDSCFSERKIITSHPNLNLTIVSNSPSKSKQATHRRLEKWRLCFSTWHVSITWNCHLYQCILYTRNGEAVTITIRLATQVDDMFRVIVHPSTIYVDCRPIFPRTLFAT